MSSNGYKVQYKVLGGVATEYRDRYGNTLKTEVDRPKWYNNEYSHTEVFNSDNKKTGSYVKSKK